ncbi:hypothetical protein [Agrobacterium sp. NPDC089420]|uniref:hypothetical protein n=1 Tax=Agrobacterium sp. NPDC089420 TaxID=3363918 RepID=UPI00384F6147
MISDKSEWVKSAVNALKQMEEDHDEFPDNERRYSDRRVPHKLYAVSGVPGACSDAEAGGFDR